MFGFVRKLAAVCAGRSSKWPAVECAFIAAHPKCEACGTKDDLNVHHIVPFHVNRTMELDTANLITLCHTDHFVIGHFHDWQSWNPNVRRMVAQYRSALDQRPT